MAEPSGRSPRPPGTLPNAPYDVVVLGAGRVGGAFARALRSAGHRVVAELRSSDDPAPLAGANVIVIAVTDDRLADAAATAARHMRPGAVVVHTCGPAGLEPLAACGRNVAAVHPAIPIPAQDTPLEGVFGVTCAEQMRDWCAAFVRDLGGRTMFVDAADRVRYHAALVMASNFSTALAGDAAELLGGHEVLVPLMRQMVDNIDRLGPDAALTGPVVRGDAGTVRLHLAALPQHLVEPYVVNARRAIARAVAAGRLDGRAAAALDAVLEEALVR